MGPNLRVVLSGACFSAWMVLLLSGHRFGGAIVLFLLAALALFPWRAARGGPPTVRDAGPSGAGSDR